MIQIIYKFLQEKGYNAQPSDMTEHIKKWAAWYKGKVTDFHSYSWYNGERYIQCERQSLQLAKIICDTWGGLLFNERCMITVDGVNITKDNELTSKTAQFVKKVFDTNNLWTRLNEAQVLKCAYGTAVWIPGAKGVDVTEDGQILGNGRIVTDIETADKMIPLSWENGIITELAVVSQKTIKGENYAYLQLFVIENRQYVIKNMLVKILNGSGYELVENMQVMPGFSKIPSRIETQSDKVPFIIDKPNLTNNLDRYSPLGISVYANAIDSIKTCDLIFDSLTTEFSLGRTRLFAAPEIMINADGKPVFDPKDIMFQLIRKTKEPEGIDQTLKVVQPALRIGEHQQGLQLALNLFSSQCGLGENYFRFDGGSIATATQVISEQSTAYRTKNKHEIILETALYDYIRLIIDIGIKTLKISDLNAEPEIKIQFDDSIIEDKTALKKQDLLELSQGVLTIPEFRMKWYGETEEQALAMLDELQDEETQEYKQISTPNAGRLTQKINAAIPQQ